MASAAPGHSTASLGRSCEPRAERRGRFESRRRGAAFDGTRTRSRLAILTREDPAKAGATHGRPAAVRLERLVKRSRGEVGRRVARSGGAPTRGATMVVAVDGVDLEIADGEFFSMLGPSGSGKTTTLRLIAGFELPTEGRVWLHGVDVTEPAAVRARRQHGLPGLRAVPAHDRRRQRRLRADGPQGPEGGARAPRRRGAGDGPARRLRAPQARRSSRAGSGSASRSRGRS